MNSFTAAMCAAFVVGTNAIKSDKFNRLAHTESATKQAVLAQVGTEATVAAE
jgi:hypothetical protein